MDGESTASGFDHQTAREKIIEAALPHVPFDGWTPEVLRRAAGDAEDDPLTALRVFPRGPVEAIEAWVGLADRRMVTALESQAPPDAKTTARVPQAIRLRLQALAAHRQAVRRVPAPPPLPPTPPPRPPPV